MAAVVARRRKRRNAPPPPIDPNRHTKWARAIGRGVCQQFRLPKGGPDEQDVESAAVLEMVRKAHQFDRTYLPKGGDPNGLFRGWCHAAIAGEARREARRLRNAGLYWTRRERGQKRIEVVSIFELRTAAGDLVELADPKSLDDGDGHDGEEFTP